MSPSVLRPQRLRGGAKTRKQAEEAQRAEDAKWMQLGNRTVPLPTSETCVTRGVMKAYNDKVMKECGANISGKHVSLSSSSASKLYSRHLFRRRLHMLPALTESELKWQEQCWKLPQHGGYKQEFLDAEGMEWDEASFAFRRKMQ